MKSIEETSKKKKINLCSGSHVLEGWVNYDIHQSKPEIEFFDVLEDFQVQGLEKESVDLVYFSHAIEHFDEVDGLEILYRIRKSLKKDGVLRIVCPSLNTYIERCLMWKEKFNKEHFDKFRNPTHFFNYAMLGEHAEGLKFLPLKNSKQILDSTDCGHKFIYSFEDLVEKLIHVGFAGVLGCDYDESEIEEFTGLESVRENNKDLILEAYMSLPKNAETQAVIPH